MDNIHLPGKVKTLSTECPAGLVSRFSLCYDPFVVGSDRQYISGTEEDIRRIMDLPEESLRQMLSSFIRNLWRVDGLYFLGIEKRFGTEAATDIDRDCWESMAALEARDLSRILEAEGGGLDALERILPFTTWVLDIPSKRITRTPEALVFEVIGCRPQTARLKKSLPVFPCRRVREGYLMRFADALGCVCRCEVCPPGEREGEVWCRWRFVNKSQS